MREFPTVTRGLLRGSREPLVSPLHSVSREPLGASPAWVRAASTLGKSLRELPTRHLAAGLGELLKASQELHPITTAPIY